jgi:hypothetical protein
MLFTMYCVPRNLAAKRQGALLPKAYIVHSTAQDSTSLAQDSSYTGKVNTGCKAQEPTSTVTADLNPHTCQLAVCRACQTSAETLVVVARRTITASAGVCIANTRCRSTPHTRPCQHTHTHTHTPPTWPMLSQSLLSVLPCQHTVAHTRSMARAGMHECMLRGIAACWYKVLPAWCTPCPAFGA